MPNVVLLHAPRQSEEQAISADTIAELEQLLKEAREGQIQGIAYVALQKGSSFSINASGAAQTAPVYTLGAVDILHDYLVKLVGP